MKDTYYLTYVLFYGLGVLTQVPGNFFVTATDYWMYKFRDPFSDDSSQNRTNLQANFASNYSIIAHVTGVLGFLFTVKYLQRYTTTVKVLGSVAGIIGVFGFTICLAVADTDSWQGAFYVLTLVTGAILSACSSIFMVTVFQMAAKFPPKYLGTLLTGQAVCGIFAALVQILSLGIGASSTFNGLIYFLIGLLFILGIAGAFLVALYKSSFFQHYLWKETEVETKVIFAKSDFFAVIGKIVYFVLSMAIVLGSTTMTYPGVTSLVVSIHRGSGSKWSDVFYVPVISFLLYHVIDCIGRELAGFCLKPKTGKVVLILSILRVLLVPLIMLCNAQPRKHLPVVLNNDVSYVILIIVFSFTHGYLFNLCVIHTPTIVQDDKERKLAIIFVLVIIIVTLGVCSFISAALVQAL